ncbi:similar to Saccharomyces cerevisiae YDL189W RBS1 Protein of unknown function [Maudiozyma saulgeensis]|uniref:R3H domain-containing protein n=1 Tax=Maudiozyma saulgeensis TaxID=1789683 RepID=A0A1X7R2T9_9SACH|nr:similar to Saccharomyces cerevisiae YDL189W RBS1 Protein of unknown function [Kazachstania saulgeensis]
MSNIIESNCDTTQLDCAQIKNSQPCSNDSDDCVNGITKALIIALFTRPLDRKFITELESNIVKFINSDARTVNLETMNSYHRFLSYKVADYHELKHTVLRKDDTPAIVLYKDTIAPMTLKLPLLKDLKLEDYSTVLISSTLEKITLNDPDGFNKQLPSKTTILKNKKVKLLKRSGKLTSNLENEKDKPSIPTIQKQEAMVISPNNLSQDSIDSLEEQRLRKEKEYEETKLKIFNDNKDVNYHNEDSEDDDINLKAENQSFKEKKNERDIEEHIWGQIEGSIPKISDDDSPRYYKPKSTKQNKDLKNPRYNNYNLKQEDGYSNMIPSNPVYPSYPVYGEYPTLPMGQTYQQYIPQMRFSPPLNGYDFQKSVPFMNYQPQQGTGFYNGYNIPMNGYGVPYNGPSYNVPPPVLNKNQPKGKNYSNDNRTPSGNGYPNK